MTQKIHRLQISTICFFIASAAFFVASFLTYSSITGSAVMFSALGSAMLCLGASSLARLKDLQEEEDQREEFRF